MTIKVLEIIGKDLFLVKPGIIDSYIDIFINRNEVHSELKQKGFVFNSDDIIEFRPRNKTIVEYKKGKRTMTTEEFNSKRTYYDSDSTEEETLRAIANRKEVEGFEPVYKDSEFEIVELDIYGKVEDTNSDFIKCSITDRWSSQGASIYTLDENRISVDEYKKLKAKYSEHARFSDLDRNYIEFAKINGNYVFTNSMFSEKRNEKVYLDLETAQQREKEIREIIQNKVKERIFPESITSEKRLMIISHLKSIKKAKSKVVMDEMLQILIDDIQDYKKQIELKSK